MPGLSYTVSNFRPQYYNRRGAIARSRERPLSIVNTERIVEKWLCSSKAAVVRRVYSDDGGDDGDGGILLFGPLTILWAWVTPWRERFKPTVVQVSSLHDLIVRSWNHPFHMIKLKQGMTRMSGSSSSKRLGVSPCCAANNKVNLVKIVCFRCVLGHVYKKLGSACRDELGSPPLSSVLSCCTAHSCRGRLRPRM